MHFNQMLNGTHFKNNFMPDNFVSIQTVSGLYDDENSACDYVFRKG